MPKYKKKPKLILVEMAPRRAGKSAKLQAVVKKIAVKAETKTRRAVARVERDAYTFAPDVLVSIGIDYKNQRIMVKAVEGEAPDLVTKLASIAKSDMVLGRMQRGWGLGRDCDHPRSRISYKNYCVGSEQGVTCFRRAKFCTACGTILSQVEDGPLKATLQEMVDAKAAYPQIRRAK